jgi:hypothetical protein
MRVMIDWGFISGLFTSYNTVYQSNDRFLPARMSLWSREYKWRSATDGQLLSDSLFYDAFPVTWLHSVGDRVKSEWFWIVKDW